MHVIIVLCSLSVIYADRSIDLAKCQRYDGDNNCEQFSFRQTSQNFTFASANSSIEMKNVTNKTIKTLDVIENQPAFEQPTIQEDGNFYVINENCSNFIQMIIVVRK